MGAPGSLVTSQHEGITTALHRVHESRTTLGSGNFTGSLTLHPYRSGRKHHTTSEPFTISIVEPAAHAEAARYRQYGEAECDACVLHYVYLKAKRGVNEVPCADRDYIANRGVTYRFNQRL